MFTFAILPLKWPVVTSEGGEWNMAMGDASWLVTKLDIGEPSLEPLVFNPFIDFVKECCYTLISSNMVTI